MAARSLQVLLPEDLDAEIAAAVSRGEYSSTDDAIAGAIEEWRVSRLADLPINGDALRRFWDEGIVSGAGGNRSIDEIKAEARQRSAQK